MSVTDGSTVRSLYIAQLKTAELSIGSGVAKFSTPVILATSSTTGNVAAVTNAINFTPPKSTGLYRVNSYTDVTAWTTPASFTVAIVHKDASGNTITVTPSQTEGDGSASGSALIDEVETFIAIPYVFQIDATGTAITVSTTGTFTGSPVYNFAAVLEQLA